MIWGKLFLKCNRCGFRFSIGSGPIAKVHPEQIREIARKANGWKSFPPSGAGETEPEDVCRKCLARMRETDLL